MGVKGLWQVLEASGQPVTLESLEGKILAVDISIWLNQSLRGVRDKYGTAKAEAHLQTLFSRICKLLYYRIKPIFVFDGRMPALKLETLNRRRNLREKAVKKSDEIRSKLLKNLVKQQALHAVMSGRSKSGEEENEKQSPEEKAIPNREHAARADQRRPRRVAAAAVAGSGRNIDAETDIFLIPGHMPSLDSLPLADMVAEDADLENDADFVLDDEKRKAEFFSDDEQSSENDDIFDEVTEIKPEQALQPISEPKQFHKNFRPAGKKRAHFVKRRRIISHMPTPAVAAEILSIEKRLRVSGQKRLDIDTVDFDAEEFKNLPSQKRHDILLDLDASRKNHSWAKMKYMPDDSNDFSGFQLGRMMKRQKVHKQLDNSIKEINARLTESIFSQHMPNAKMNFKRVTNIQSKKFAAEDSAHFVLVNLKPTADAEFTDVDRLVNGAVDDGKIDTFEPSDAVESDKAGKSAEIIEILSDDDDDETDDFTIEKVQTDQPVSLADKYMDLLFEAAEPKASRRHRGRTNNDFQPSTSVKSGGFNDETPEIVEVRIDDADERRKQESPKFVAPTTPPPPSRPATIPVVLSNKDSDDVDKRKVIDLLGHCIENELTTTTDNYLRAALERQRQQRQERRSKRYLRVEDVFASVITSSSVSTAVNNNAESISVVITPNEPAMFSRTAATATSENLAKKPGFLCREVSYNSNESETTTTTTTTTSTATRSSAGDEIFRSIDEDDVFVVSDNVEKAEPKKSVETGHAASYGKFTRPEPSVPTPSSVVLRPKTTNNEETEKTEQDDEEEEIEDDEFVDVPEVIKTDERIPSSAESSPLEILDDDDDDDDIVPIESTDHRFYPNSSSSSLVDARNAQPVEKAAAETEKASSASELKTQPSFDIDDADELIGLEDIDFDAEPKPSSSAEFLPEPQKEDLFPFDHEQIRQKQLDELDDLSTEQLELLRAAGREQRMATSVTDQIISDCIELLKLFGLPFVMAPSEAEAQCAYLDATNQTQGSITDDSDAWLFGARRIYKSFFNQRHKVEFFTAESCLKHVGLTRERMIAFAMLTGCDYTDGLQGVGSVAGMEILAEFADEESERNIDEFASSDDAEKLLTNFARWLRAARRRFGEEKENKFREKLKSSLSNFPPSSNFPDQRIIDAFRRPLVDESREPFSWSRPDLKSLRQFMRMRVGWSVDKLDELLNPVVKRQKDEEISGKQRRIDEFFARKPPAIVRVVKDPALMAGSKRLNKAISRVKSLKTADADDDAVKVMKDDGLGRLGTFDGDRTKKNNLKRNKSAGGGGFFAPMNFSTSTSQNSSKASRIDEEDFEEEISVVPKSSSSPLPSPPPAIRSLRKVLSATEQSGSRVEMNGDRNSNVSSSEIVVEQLERRRASKRALGIREDLTGKLVGPPSRPTKKLKSTANGSNGRL